MKFLILALCFCAANAASIFDNKPWQFQRTEPQRFGQAFAKAVVTAPEVVYRTVEQPAIRIEEQPIIKATPAPVLAAPAPAPVAVAKSAVYAPVPAVKNVYGDNKEANAEILRSESDVAADSFNYAYETQNGISAQSSGVLKSVDNTPVLVIQGSYKYTAPDGTPVQFSYTADENGYQPQSDLLPVGPAIPEAIARSLEYLRVHAKPENF